MAMATGRFTEPSSSLRTHRSRTASSAWLALVVACGGVIAACSSDSSGGRADGTSGGAPSGGTAGTSGGATNGGSAASSGHNAQGGAGNADAGDSRGGGATGGIGNSGGNAASNSSGGNGAGGSPGSMGSGGLGSPDAGPIMAPEPLSPNIVVDQFGYRTSAEKVAVIRSPERGFDAGRSFTPGATYALVDAHTGAKKLERPQMPWNGGATDASSGDKAWWFDFSSVTTPGDYYVLDESKNVRSDVFAIADGVYRDVLVQAVRMLYYQRDGQAKTAANAGAAWVDAAAHMGKCYLYSDAQKAQDRDLHGGWWDAGDFNKYTNWGAGDVIELLNAYVDSPAAFSDDTNIPESGNRVPDVLDEIKWEVDFLVRMQSSDGSVLSIVNEPSAPGGTLDTSPSKVTTPCKYGPATTAASLTTAAAFAYMASVLESVNGAGTAYPKYGDDLLTRAKTAYAWAEANPAVFFYNSQNGVGAGEQEVSQNQPDRDNALRVKHLQAALYLFEATGETTYRDYFDQNYANVGLVKTSYADNFHGEEQETLLEYTRAANATGSVVQKIKSVYATALQSNQNLGSVAASPDPYMAPLAVYTWGSNQIKAEQGNLLYDSIAFGINPSNDEAARKGAERYVHYLHGVNPLQIVYLSNMGDHGASKSVTRFFHSWYAKGSNWDAFGVSKYGPPPGYLTGGPNPSYSWDSCCPGGCGVSCGASPPSPPTGQPDQKAYLDFNDSWPLGSWAITEPDDGYQAKYIRLLAKFVK
jgi:endoglucanase